MHSELHQKILWEDDARIHVLLCARASALHVLYMDGFRDDGIQRHVVATSHFIASGRHATCVC